MFLLANAILGALSSCVRISCFTLLSPYFSYDVTVNSAFTAPGLSAFTPDVSCLPVFPIKPILSTKSVFSVKVVSAFERILSASEDFSAFPTAMLAKASDLSAVAATAFSPAMLSEAISALTFVWFTVSAESLLFI